MMALLLTWRYRASKISPPGGRLQTIITVISAAGYLYQRSQVIRLQPQAVMKISRLEKVRREALQTGRTTKEVAGCCYKGGQPSFTKGLHKPTNTEGELEWCVQFDQPGAACIARSVSGVTRQWAQRFNNMTGLLIPRGSYCSHGRHCFRNFVVTSGTNRARHGMAGKHKYTDSSKAQQIQQPGVFPRGRAMEAELVEEKPPTSQLHVIRFQL